MEPQCRQSLRTVRAAFVVPFLLALAIGGLVGSAHAASRKADLESLLGDPPSPGSIALLWDHASEPRVAEKLAAALSGPDPRTRAAAARVADVTNSTALLPVVGRAFEAETDLDAAGEEVRAI